MFKQKDYQFYELAKKKIEQYVIEPGDQFTLQVYSRDGFKLIDVLSSSAGANVNGSGAANVGGSTGNTTGTAGPTAAGGSVLGVTYLVDHEGYANLPVLGEFYVKGYSETELERILEEKYSKLFVDPYAILKVVNRRVFVFKGSTGAVIGLNEAPTNLLEVIARSGGLEQNLKAYRVKLIRGDLKNPQIQLIDLSTLEGVRKAELIVQSNDIIYIERRKKIVTDVLLELTPLFTLASLITSTVVLIKAFGK